MNTGSAPDIWGGMCNPDGGFAGPAMAPMAVVLMILTRNPKVGCTP